MATSKVHILMSLLSGYSIEEAVLLTTPDSMRCWSGPRQFSHFTINPSTQNVSWMRFPETPVNDWNKELIDAAEKFDAGKPGVAAVDEATIPAEFWKHNSKTPQNELFYAHLVQDVLYDDYLRTYIDVSRMYEDIYLFDGKVFSGEEFRKSGDSRWNRESLVSSFDTQVFIGLAKLLYESKKIIANRAWFEKEVFPAFYESYSNELAEKTIRFITMSDFADETISKLKFDYQHGPVNPCEVENFMMTATAIGPSI
ncbi:MAG: hypothetical protein J6J60_06430 [Clostridia bacterium]|nr:hypothetical protein [Clostridia bacterium]